MSVTGNFSGNVHIPFSQVTTGSVAIVGDAITNDTMTLASFAFANASGGSVTCELHWYDSASSTQRLVWIGAVASNTTVVIDSLPLRLVNGDEIRAKGAASVYCTLSYIQTFQTRATNA